MCGCYLVLHRSEIKTLRAANKTHEKHHQALLRKWSYLVERMTWFSTLHASSSNNAGIWGDSGSGDVAPPSPSLATALLFAAATATSVLLLAMHRRANRCLSTPLPCNSYRVKRVTHRARCMQSPIETSRPTRAALTLRDGVDH